MTSRPRTSKGRSLLRLAVVGAVAAGTPLALAGTASAAPDSAWDKLAQCESGGNWSINTGNGYYGGIQFDARTWHAFGGTGLPHQASRSQQIAVAERTLAAQGWGSWPACSRKMGLRGYGAQPGKAAAPVTPAPPGRAEGLVPTAPAVHAAPQAPIGPAGTYTVQRGDTLGRIAQAHGTSVKALFDANRGVLSNPNVLRVGTALNV